MTTDPMSRLSAADPAADLTPPPSEELLRHTLSLPRPAAPSTSRPDRSRWRRRALSVVAVAGVAAAIVGIATVAGPRGGGSLDLAAQAYAQTSAASDQIIHTVVTSTGTEFPVGGRPPRRDEGRIEEWHRGRETHRIETVRSSGGRPTTLDHVIDARGVMYQVTSDGGYRIVQPSDNEDAATVIDREQQGFIATFRSRYEQGQLDPAGNTRFAGRPAERYVVASTDTGGPAPLPQPRLVFYIDRETGAPLGSTSTMTLGTATMRGEQIVRKIEQLEPTPANLERLHTLSLPRRRDADGCIRGPVTDARSSSTAAKSDCGGGPAGAPLPR